MAPLLSHERTVVKKNILTKERNVKNYTPSPIRYPCFSTATTLTTFSVMLKGILQKFGSNSHRKLYL